MSGTSPKRSLLRRLRSTAVERMDDHDVRWRSLGALFAAGGILALLSLLLPVDPDTRKLAVFLVGAVAVVTGAVLIGMAQRLPRADGWLSGVLAFGTVLITLAVIFNRSTASPYSVIYIWVAFDGFYFLRRRAAYGHLVWLAVNYAVALTLAPTEGHAAAARWFLLLGTVSVIGGLTDLLRTRSDALIAQLGAAARTDALTGLLNRRGFEQRLEEDLARALRSGESVSLLVIDLDHFKLLNDRFGHHRGDEALRIFAGLAADTQRATDSASRIGGEEFALILPDTDPHGAYLVAERLRRRVREPFAAIEAPLSASFGIATYPDHGTSADSLLRSADQAMYLAKRLGRDRSVIFSAEVSATFPTAPEESAASIEHLPAVLILAETLDMRDTGTAAHSHTVGGYAQVIAIELGLAQDRVERIRLAGLLHDIGKIGVPDPILRKPGALDAAEWAKMKKHPELGARILAGAGLQDISDWVTAHHERPDGTGYPLGLAAEAIPLEARILAVADAFEAMTADRVYRAGMPLEEAVDELRRHAGGQFDEAVVAAFLRGIDVVRCDDAAAPFQRR